MSNELKNSDYISWPDPWVQYIDPVTGKTYYENQYVSIENSGIKNSENNVHLSVTLFFISWFIFWCLFWVVLYKVFSRKK